MKKAIIIPLSLPQIKSAGGMVSFRGVRLTRRAIESMEKLEGKAHLYLSRTRLSGEEGVKQGRRMHCQYGPSLLGGTGRLVKISKSQRGLGKGDEHPR